MRQTKKFLVDIAVPALCVCAIAYFSYGAIAGASGYQALTSLQLEADEISAELDQLTNTRIALESRADLLNPRSLDPDMVDERIRAVLGFANEEDLVLPRDELDRMIAAAKRDAKGASK